MTRVLTLSLPPETATPSLLANVDHAIGELRRGRYVIILPTLAGEDRLLMQAAEAVTPQSLGMLARLSGQPTELALTLRRAMVLGLVGGDSDGTSADPTDVVLVAVPSGLKAEETAALVLPRVGRPLSTLLPESVSTVSLPSRSTVGAAVRLTKLARLLPAAMVTALPKNVRMDLMGRTMLTEGMAAHVTVATEEVNAYDEHVVRTLRPVSEARVPLAGAEDARLIAFRPGDGGIEHLAIIIGDPDGSTPVLTRLHSECFTGDLLGSLRCDCGNQLRGAITAITTMGAGVLLYLAQEGRGIGLVNKLRAYQLQDHGFDTLDANGQLGFDDDERIYLPAAAMLRQLGFQRVRLMTNNPHKVEALVHYGIEVVERIPHVFPANHHNLSYLRTKATRGGHLF